MLLRLSLILAMIGSPASAEETLVSGAELHESSMTVAAKKRRKKRRRRKRKRARKKRVVAKPVSPSTKPSSSTPIKVAVPPKKERPKKAKAPGIAIKDLISVHGVPAGIATLLNDLILTQLKRSERFSSVISGSDMADMIDLEAQKQALGCDEESCLAELGGALGVPYMLAANLGKIGREYLITLKVISIDEAKVVVRIVDRAGSEDVLVDVVTKVLDKAIIELLGKSERAPPTVAEPVAPNADPPPVLSSAVTARGERKAGRPMLKWSGIALGLSGTGWAAYHVVQWSDEQTAFDAHPSPYTSDLLDDLEKRTDQANQGLIQGLSAAGVGVLLAWLGW